jgi:2-dehydropantoate 2-reductase
MGSFLGALLSQRHDVTLIGRADHVEAIRRRGLRVTGKLSRIARPQASVRVPKGIRPDLVIVATKSYDTQAALRQLAAFASSALFLTLQNGLDNGATIARVARRVAVGTTALGVTFVEPGTVRLAGVGETVLGPWANVDGADLVRLRDLLEDAGLTARITSNVQGELWAKVVMNASINPLAALAGVPNGRLVADPHLAAALDAVCREAAGVAKAAGAAVDPDELVRRTVLVARRTAANRCSMLQDLDRGRRTEIEAITGAVLREARDHGVAAPLNELLYALVRAREGMGSRRA